MCKLCCPAAKEHNEFDSRQLLTISLRRLKLPKVGASCSYRKIKKFHFFPVAFHFFSPVFKFQLFHAFCSSCSPCVLLIHFMVALPFLPLYDLSIVASYEWTFFQDIGKVEMFKRLGWNSRSIGVEARVGDIKTHTSHGRKVITVNTKCGSRSSVDNNHDSAVFLCNPPLAGRYLTLQTMAHRQMNIGEVNIYIDRECIYPIIEF